MAEIPRIQELKRRIQQDPASIAFATLAEEYRRAGRYADAIAACRAGLQRHPSYISAHVTLGRALLEIREFEQAREELELVLRVAPENLAAIRGLAEIHRRQSEATETHELAGADMAETGGGAGETTAAPASVELTSPATPAAATRTPIRYEVRPAPALESFCAEFSLPVATQQAQPSEDRALAGLEEFLDAIIRVRKAAAGIHAA